MTNEEVMQILTDMGLHEGGMDNWVADNAWWKFANVVAQHEREACAKVCDLMAVRYEDMRGAALESAAESIRLRGQA
jgi:hypothetical protein